MKPFKWSQGALAGVFTEYAVATPGCGPFGITAGPDGAMWFTCFANGRVGRITTSGIAADYMLSSSTSAPIDIVSGPLGRLWFTENNDRKIGSIVP